MLAYRVMAARWLHATVRCDVVVQLTLSDILFVVETGANLFTCTALRAYDMRRYSSWHYPESRHLDQDVTDIHNSVRLIDGTEINITKLWMQQMRRTVLIDQSEAASGRQMASSLFLGNTVPIQLQFSLQVPLSYVSPGSVEPLPMPQGCQQRSFDTKFLLDYGP